MLGGINHKALQKEILKHSGDLFTHLMVALDAKLAADGKTRADIVSFLINGSHDETDPTNNLYWGFSGRQGSIAKKPSTLIVYFNIWYPPNGLNFATMHCPEYPGDDGDEITANFSPWMYTNIKRMVLALNTTYEAGVPANFGDDIIIAYKD